MPLKKASKRTIRQGSSKKPKVYFRPKEPKELIKSEFFHEWFYSDFWSYKSLLREKDGAQGKKQ